MSKCYDFLHAIYKEPQNPAVGYTCLHDYLDELWEDAPGLYIARRLPLTNDRIMTVRHAIDNFDLTYPALSFYAGRLASILNNCVSDMGTHFRSLPGYNLATYPQVNYTWEPARKLFNLHCWVDLLVIRAADLPALCNLSPPISRRRLDLGHSLEESSYANQTHPAGP